MTTKAKKYVLQKHFNGLPKSDDLQIVEETLPSLKPGGKSSIKPIQPSKNYFLEYLVEAVYLSVDPYMRAREPSLDLGTVFVGSQVGKYVFIQLSLNSKPSI